MNALLRLICESVTLVSTRLRVLKLGLQGVMRGLASRYIGLDPFEGTEILL